MYKMYACGLWHYGISCGHYVYGSHNMRIPKLGLEGPKTYLFLKQSNLVKATQYRIFGGRLDNGISRGKGLS